MPVGIIVSDLLYLFEVWLLLLLLLFCFVLFCFCSVVFLILNILQIALRFPTAFWRKKIREADYFGHVPGTSEERGLFSVFYDVSKDVSRCI